MDQECQHDYRNVLQCPFKVGKWPRRSRQWSRWAVADTPHPCCFHPARCRSRWSWEWRQTAPPPERRTGNTDPATREPGNELNSSFKWMCWLHCFEIFFSPCFWGWTAGSVVPHEPAAGWRESSCCPVWLSPCRLSPPRPEHTQTKRKTRHKAMMLQFKHCSAPIRL